jgi:predicted PurR-regulated permease PerM
VVIGFVGLFGAVEPEVYREGLSHLISPRHRGRAAEALTTLAYNLRWWLVAQLIPLLMMWIRTTLGLWLIGVPLAFALGVIAGILEIIPYFGPWLFAVPALLIAFLPSPWHVAMVAGLYLGLHFLEGYVPVSLVQRGVVQLPPTLTLVAQALFGELLVLLGFFVAAPVTVAAVVLLKMLYVEETLGDPEVQPPGEPSRERRPTSPAG